MPRPVKTFYYTPMTPARYRDRLGDTTQCQTAVRALSRTAAIDAFNRAGILVSMHTFKSYASEGKSRPNVEAHPLLTVLAWPLRADIDKAAPVVIEPIR